MISSKVYPSSAMDQVFFFFGGVKFVLVICLVANIFEDKTFMRKEISVHNMVPSNSVLERNNGLEKE